MFIVVQNDSQLEIVKSYKNINVKIVKLTTIHNFHSIQLREKIKNNEFIEEETNSKVNEYIINNELYR